MKSLAERHAERAQRKADNSTEFTGGTKPDIGAAVIAAQQAADLVFALPEEQRAIFNETIASYNPAEARSIAEDENGNSMAGIGVINTKVVPATAEGGNGGGAGGWVNTPESTIDTSTGANINGQALEDQGVAGNAPAEKPAKK